LANTVSSEQNTRIQTSETGGMKDNTHSIHTIPDTVKLKKYADVKKCTNL